MDFRWIIDKLLLIVVGLACAFMAWLFWTQTQNDGFHILITIILVATFAEKNIHLRRKLKRSKERIKNLKATNEAKQGSQTEDRSE